MSAEHPYVAMMSPSVPTPPMTADELLRVHLPDKEVELVRGVLVVREPPGYAHGAVVARLTAALAGWVDAGDLGRVLAGDPGFTLATSPDTVRGPDVAFIRRDRVPHPAPTGFASLAPDLVVEVRSPRDRPGEVLAKVGDWLSAGTRLVWVIDPERRAARVYRADGSETLIAEDGALSGEDVVPGFTCSLASLL